jgi:enterochelin esterase family protein
MGRPNFNGQSQEKQMKICASMLALALGQMMFCAVLFGQNTPKVLTSAPAAQNLQVAPEDREKMTVLPPYQVLPDNRVVFRLKAPQAMNVAVRGEWPGGLQGSSTIPMAKNEEGIWIATVGPLPSDLWSYNFVVDGVTVSPTFGPIGGPAGLPANNFVIPGPYGNDFAPHGAPEGVATYAYVPFMGSKKALAIYTPPDYYEHRAKRYPVLYLTMGGLHDDSDSRQDAFHPA